MRRFAGFTLIELLVVIVIISVGLAGLAKLFGNTNLALATGESAQVTAQYAQECAEYVLGVRRDQGFGSVNTNTCNALPPLPAGYTRSPLTLTADTSGACPNGSTCTDVKVTVSRGTISSDVTFMLVQ